jgi:hypothetical protein
MLRTSTSEQTESVENSNSHVHIEIDPWPVLWTVVGAWMIEWKSSSKSGVLQEVCVHRGESA